MRALLTVLYPFTYFMTDSSEESAQTTLHVLLNDETVPQHSGAYFSQHSYLYSDAECKKGGWPMESPNPNAKDLAKAKEPVKVTRIPEPLMRWAVRLVRLFSRHQGELLAFFSTMATTDVVAPSSGTHTLEGHFRQLGGES